MNGWQTAYGYAGGDFRDRFLASAAELRARARDRATETFTDERERGCSSGSSRTSTASWSSDEVAWRSLRTGDPDRTKRILLGPELNAVRDDGRQPPTSSPTTRLEQAAATEDSFDDARDEARRRLIAVALGAAVVIVLLLVTANDIAKMALEGERHVRGRREPDPESDDEPS